MNPTKNIISKKQQYQDHIHKKRFNTGHIGRKNHNYVIFIKRHNQGKANERRIYSAKAQGFISIRSSWKIKLTEVIDSIGTDSTLWESKILQEESNSSGSPTW